MEIGAFNFGDLAADGSVSPAQRARELIEEVALAEQVGLDVYGLGEHHHPAFAVAAPPVLLAAAAARTERIRLTSAVTVLGSDDPVRVFEQFTALDLASDGRAEIMVGRGALLDSFRLFGQDPAEYDALFDEKLRLLFELRTG
jgi:alkanesulfonate monooxygenase SsuD/methylene tetrahydromethanopterin reductase-like flavin-dependent oxidoreductase (luciferase family)